MHSPSKGVYRDHIVLSNCFKNSDTFLNGSFGAKQNTANRNNYSPTVQVERKLFGSVMVPSYSQEIA